MPSNRATGGAAGAAGVVGLVAGLALAPTPGPPAHPLCVDPPRSRHARVVPDLDRIRVEATEAGDTVAVVPRRRPDGTLIENAVRTPERVLAALDACDRYETERGKVCPRRAEWEAVAEALSAVMGPLDVPPHDAEPGGP